MSKPPSQHSWWPQFAILAGWLLVGVVSQSIWVAGYVDARTQPLWSTMNWGAGQSHISLLGFWYGLRVASWRGAVAMAFLIVCYHSAMYLIESGREWQSGIDSYAAHFWYQVCSPIILIAGTLSYRRRSTRQFSLRDIVGLTALFALVLAFVNSFTSDDTMFHLVRGLLIYLVTLAAALITMPIGVHTVSRLGVLIVTVAVGAVPPLALGWHSMWILQFPMTSAWLAIFVIASLVLLKRLESGNTSPADGSNACGASVP